VTTTENNNNHKLVGDHSLSIGHTLDEEVGVVDDECAHDLSQLSQDGVLLVHLLLHDLGVVRVGVRVVRYWVRLRQTTIGIERQKKIIQIRAPNKQSKLNKNKLNKPSIIEPKQKRRRRKCTNPVHPPTVPDSVTLR
jgi:hypothetical protein